ncbi:MAG: type I-E CRISPR-associated protein Cse2/CasB [Rhodospirillaceae bacterium]|mgnify:CR=1 FL=1|jgi:CRISPR system Cascade subunit CasB|nr:type I-E CRISPR-associated protein Cse2/CasB [Rhodospirillaceae bacterium]|tara:strand:+ start:2801 stop:3283 length:483 start_codon:yes stop_codon:yes gene_type:complete
MKTKFQPDSEAGKIIHEWWQSLESHTGERAMLRRAKSVDGVVISRSFHQLCRRLRPLLQGEYHWEERLAVVAGLLSHVRGYANRPLAEQMAGNPPEVSELRFRRMLQRDRGDLYKSMIRVLRMLDNKADIYDLSDSVFYWGDPVKKRWAYSYFPNTPASK